MRTYNLVNILNKTRSWDKSNVGMLIVFAIVIIIAVGALGVYAYFFQDHQEEWIMMSVLGDTSSSIEDIIDAGICSTDTGEAGINYNTLSSEYTIYCDEGFCENDGQDCNLEEDDDVPDTRLDDFAYTLTDQIKKDEENDNYYIKYELR